MPEGQAGGGRHQPKGCPKTTPDNVILAVRQVQGEDAQAQSGSKDQVNASDGRNGAEIQWSPGGNTDQICPQNQTCPGETDCKGNQ